MKKLIFLSLFCWCMSSIVTHAQIGIKAGASLNAVGSYGNSEEGETADLKTGYQLGLFYKANLTNKIGLILELNLEQRGTVSKKNYVANLPVIDPSSGTVLGIGDYTIDQEANSSHTYINVPVLLTFGGERLKFYVGPNIAYLVRAKADFNRNIDASLGGNALPGPARLELEGVDWLDYDSFKDIFNDPKPAEDGEFLNSFELGINVGAMFSITDALFANARINQGLTDSTNDAYDNSIYPNETTFQFGSRGDVDRNFSLQLGIGYRF